MSHIYWYCLDTPDLDEALVSQVLQELSDNLRKFPTRIEVVIELEELPENLRPAVRRQLQEARSFVETAAQIGDILCTGKGCIPRLLVFCRRDSKIAKQAREEKPSAQWGAKCGCLAVVWEWGNKINKMLIWHEVLHLLGAKDCYVGEANRGFCEKEPMCIMQWEPTEESVAKWPDCLCFGTIYLLRSCNANPHGKKANLREFIEKNFNEEKGLFWYSRRHKYTVCDSANQPWGRHTESMISWHTKYVSRDTSFEAASADSISFQYYGKDVNELPSGSHAQWGTPEENISSYRTGFSDGSSITKAYTYAIQDEPGEQGQTKKHDPITTPPRPPYQYADLPATVLGTPLHQVAAVGEESEADALIAQGADVNAKDEYCMTPLHEAAALGREGMASLLIAKGADILAKNMIGDTPMHCAAWEGHVNFIGLLINHGGDLHAENSKGEPPLFLAVRQQHKEAIEFLIEEGADVNYVNQKGETPLHLAATRGDVRVAEILITKGAKLEAKDALKNTPFSEAMSHFYIAKGVRGTCDRSMVEFLLAKGANVNAQDYDGRTALVVASSEGDQEMVEFLLANGADPNARTHNGDTALHKAVENGHTKVVERLLANKADPNLENNEGIRPLQIAIDGGHEELVTLLRRCGAL